MEPLVWSALQAWWDGGPPIPRYVVPFNPQKTDSNNKVSYSPSPKSMMSSEEYEIELYPLYASIFLCDAASKGEPRPFQQFVPMSRYLPLNDLITTLCEGLGSDTDIRPHCRLWMMDASGASMTRSVSSSSKADDSLGWILDTELPIGDERNMRGAQLGKDENINLMLELRNDEDGSWPRTKSKMVKPNLEHEGQVGEDATEEESDDMKLGDGIVGLYNMG